MVVNQLEVSVLPTAARQENNGHESLLTCAKFF